MKRFLEWFLKFFQPTLKPPRRVKFLEGTEWLCPHCSTTIAIARRDIHCGEMKSSSAWDVKDAGFWRHSHCGQYIARFKSNGTIQFYTPTGWVG